MPRALDRAIAGSVRLLSRSMVQRFARGYIAGDTLDHALAAVEQLAAAGCVATVDLLGEHVVSRDQALGTRLAYGEALARLDAHGLPSGISVKPTALGLTRRPPLLPGQPRGSRGASRRAPPVHASGHGGVDVHRRDA